MKEQKQPGIEELVVIIQNQRTIREKAEDLELDAWDSLYPILLQQDPKTRRSWLRQLPRYTGPSYPMGRMKHESEKEEG